MSTEGHTLGGIVADCCGLTDLYPSHKYPDARVDAYLFTPCGFSAKLVSLMDWPGGLSSLFDLSA